MLQIDPELVLPTMRSAVEEQLSLIAKGKVCIDGLCDRYNNYMYHYIAPLEMIKGIYGTII